MPRSYDYNDEPTIPTRKKYRAAFDRGCSAANEGMGLGDNPYGDNAPQRSKCWRNGWHHWHNKRTISEDELLDIFEAD